MLKTNHCTVLVPYSSLNRDDYTLQGMYVWKALFHHYIVFRRRCSTYTSTIKTNQKHAQVKIYTRKLNGKRHGNRSAVDRDAPPFIVSVVPRICQHD